jgi:hypothetical protein
MLVAALEVRIVSEGVLAHLRRGLARFAPASQATYKFCSAAETRSSLTATR